METRETGAAIETPLAAMHKDSGATLGTWFGCVLPDHWIDPREEQEFAPKSVALVDKNCLAYLSFTGPDRVRYLNAILTNNIKDLQVGQGNSSLLLNPQGHILAEVETYVLPESLFCLSYAMIRERLIEVIEKYIIMDDVTLTDESQRYGALAIEGPRAADVVRELTGIDLLKFTELSRREATVASIPCLVKRRSPGGVAGCEFLVERGELKNLWQTLSESVKKHGGGPMGYAALSAQRLAQGVPWFGYDFGEKQIPHEAGLQDSHISYTKGCYTGQEIVERVRSRGQVNRRRVDLIFDSAGVPVAGETLTVDGKEVGFVTRAAVPSFLTHAIGMGYVRKDHNALGSTLKWSRGTAVVAKFPGVLYGMDLNRSRLQITRSLLASFIERAVTGHLEENEWSDFAVNHYHDEKMENARRECVRIFSAKTNDDIPRLEKTEIDRLNFLASDLRSSKP